MFILGSQIKLSILYAWLRTKTLFTLISMDKHFECESKKNLYLVRKSHNMNVSLRISSKGWKYLF